MTKIKDDEDLQEKRKLNNIFFKDSVYSADPNCAFFIPDVICEVLDLAKSDHADNELGLGISETRVNCSIFEVRSIIVAAGVTVSINLNNHPEHKTVFLEPHAAANFRKQLSDGSWTTAKFIADDSYTEVPLAALEFKPIDY